MKRLYQFKSLLNQSAIKHIVTQKSKDEELLFSLALHTGEDNNLIIKNRDKIAYIFGVNSSFIVANQTHSINIKIIDKQASKGWKSLGDSIENCDALITNQKGIVLTILTADCVPILLYDKRKKVVSAIHAGWRGTQGEISKKTVDIMKKRFGSNPLDIVVGIAPAIGECCYEVEIDVASHFFAYPNALNQREDKYDLNLPLINQEQLIASGIPKENIEMSGICTACSVESYFSYRKEKGCSGRFMSMIGLV